MKNKLFIIKNLITITFLLILNIAEGQYYQWHFNLNDSLLLLRNERFNSGIRTRVNYINNTPAFFYYAGIGTSYNNVALAPPDNLADRMRFTLLGTQGITVFSNLGYEFSGNDNLRFHSQGNSIAEIDNGGGSGGYVAVGAVTNNPITGAGTIAGNSDILFTRLGPLGTVANASGTDIHGGNDIAECIRKSKVPDQQGNPTWIMCGHSAHANYTDCFVARIRVDGSIVWCFRYNFDPVGPPFTSAHCIAKQLCEDTNGNIYVVGSLQDNQGGGNINGLVFRLNTAGAVQWVRSYDAAMDDEFQAVRLAAGNRLIIGGFTNFMAIAPVTHNMLIVKLSTAGAILFENVLEALANNGVTKFTSKCYDIIETAGPQYFLAGSLIRNGTNVEMMYRVSAGGMPVNWYSYHEMLYNVGFGLDDVNVANSPGIVYFSSLKNPVDATFSDSHIMKTDYLGRTCGFCAAKPPSDIPINMEIHIHNNWLQKAAGSTRKLIAATYNYDDALICNESEIHCTNANVAKSNVKQEAANLVSANIKLSPNPVMGTLHIQVNSLPAGEYQITLTDMEGKLVLQRNRVYNNGLFSTDLDMSSVASGIYLLTIKQGELVLQQKVVKQ